jgi:CRISPR-associated protein Csm2
MVDVTFYRDKVKRTLEAELFSSVAETLAKELSASQKSNKRTQIRKFYDEVLRLNSLAKSNPNDWDNILPYANMLIAKATYARGRNLVTEEFVEFIKKSMSQIHDPKDLDVFANLFEAFMGYYRKYKTE